jgi:hypothetical protein
MYRAAIVAKNIRIPHPKKSGTTFPQHCNFKADKGWWGGYFQVVLGFQNSGYDI